MSAEEILMNMIEALQGFLEELSEVSDRYTEQFEYGEKTAYIECLEMIQLWKKAKSNGLNFDIEKRFPL